MTELASIALQGMHFRPSDDGTHQKMVFEDSKSNSVGVVLPTESVRDMATHLMEYVIKLETEGALASSPSDTPDQPSQSLPATESALLYVRDMNLVRWEGGAAVLQVQTTTGIAVHLALNDAHQHYLMSAMSDPLPKE